MAKTLTKKSTAKELPKKKKQSKEEVGPSEILRTEKISVDELNYYYQNPRIGNVDEVAKSLHINGQYRAIVVNVGTKTGRANEVLAGNHTLKAAKKELEWQAEGKMYEKPSWTHMHVSFVDVGEKRAKAIVLADNKTAELGTYDDKVMAGLLQGLDTISGTGFQFDEAQTIIEDFGDINTADLGLDDEDIEEYDDNLITQPQIVVQEPEMSEREKRIHEREEEGEIEADKNRGVVRVKEADEDKELENVSVAQELQVLLELKEDPNYAGNNKWGIADLRTDMLLEKLPKNLTTWAGRKLTPPDDEKQHFLYCYGNGPRIDLPVDRSIMAFWAHDEKFDVWWDTPSYYTAKFMSQGLTTIITPDFSYYGKDTRTMHLWNAHRAQWMGRYFQEAGLKLIPRFQFSQVDPDPLEISLLGMPRKIPVLGIELQNFANKDEEKHGAAVIKEALQEIKVDTILLYGNNPAKRCMDMTGFNGDIVQLETYFSICKRDRDQRTHKGSDSLNKKQREAIIEKENKRMKG